MSSFEIKNRRGGNKEAPAPAIIPAVASEPTGDNLSWEDVKYAIAWRPIPQRQPGPLQIILMGRAIGLRSDGLPFVADYWFEPEYDPDWQVKVKKRLDTFLGCGCNDFSPCAVHKMYFGKWAEADTQRLTMAGERPVPTVLEILHKAEMARQQRAQSIVVPRG